jgi:DNA (cytosine-5)-methyltransferase 1
MGRTVKEKTKHKVGSLFAGVGGICQAFMDSKCNVIWANEIDSKACETYKLNHKEVNLIENDIKNIGKENLTEIDILTAGFPCQPFSHAGQGKGFEDERGQLFFDVIRILKELQPKVLLLENVKTLATHDGKCTFNRIKNEIKNAGYSFIPFILNSAECTNIPQSRERIYIVGFRGENDYYFDEPVHSNENSHSKSKLSSKFVIPKKLKKTNKEVKEFLDRSTIIDSDIYCNYENIIHKRIISAVKKENTVYQYRRYYVRENKSNLCPTLTANMGGGGHNVPIILDGEFPRRLTPKECFNLQGFPQRFKLPTNMARGALYKQAGNSVVIPVIEKIAKEIKRVLDEN